MSRRIWTIEKCKRFANKCKTRTEMLKRFPRAYDAAISHKWINIIFADRPNQGFDPRKKVDGYWTNQRLMAAAAQCSDRKEFWARFQSAYGIASSKGIIDQLFCKHPNQGFDSTRRRDGYWNSKRNCKQAARLCKTRTEFLKKFKAGYSSAHRHGWLDEVCAHMEVRGNRTKRFIYEFIDLKNKEIYVGLTYNVQERLANHKSKGRPEIKRMLERGCKIKVSSHPLPAKEAQLEEARLIKQWQTTGFVVWNRSRAGALGSGSRHWTFERCRDVAEKCKNREEMRRKYNGAAQTATKRGWLDKIFKNHPTQGFKQKPHGYWTKTQIKKLALQYATRSEFKVSEKSAYARASQEGWLEEIFKTHKNLGFKSVGNKFWNYETCKEAAQKAKTRSRFYTDYPGAVAKAIDNNWMEEIFKDLPNQGYEATPRNYWTLERLLDEVRKYKTRTEFQRANLLAYSSAHRKKQIDYIFRDHPNQGYKHKPYGYWTIQRSVNEAQKFESRMQLKRQSCAAYHCLRKNGLLDECFPK